MKVEKPNNLFKAVLYGILVSASVFYLTGDYQSITASKTDTWHSNSYLVFSNNANHSSYPLAAYLALISEYSEELSHSKDKESFDKNRNGQALTILSHRLIAVQASLPRVTQPVLNRKKVLLFILYHSWKSFLC